MDLKSTLPCSNDDERGFLSALVSSQPDEIENALEGEFGDPDLFYDMRLQTIFRAVSDLARAGEPVGSVAVASKISETGGLQRAGGITMISEVFDIGIPGSLKFHGERLVGLMKRRKLIQACWAIAERARSGSEDADSVLASAEAEILAIDKTSEIKKARRVSELMPEVIASIEEAWRSGGKPQGITTGLVDLDRLSRGLKAGDMIVLAGRTSTGKTSLALTICDHVATHDSIPVGMFSLEMTSEQLTQRLLLSKARVSLYDVANGKVTERDFPKLTNAAATLNKAPIYVDDQSGLNIDQVWSRARRMVKRLGVKVIVIDYLQRLSIDGKDPVVGYTLASKGCKDMAKDLKVPVIVLSQLNRDSERGSRRRPILSDLKQTGSIEEDADMVGLLWTPDEDEDPFADTRNVQLILEKNRGGQTGPVDLVFHRNYTRMDCVAKIGHEDIPN